MSSSTPDDSHSSREAASLQMALWNPPKERRTYFPAIRTTWNPKTTSGWSSENGRFTTGLLSTRFHWDRVRKSTPTTRHEQVRPADAASAGSIDALRTSGRRQFMKSALKNKAAKADPALTPESVPLGVPSGAYGWKEFISPPWKRTKARF